jgi:hypothetical protein
MDANRQQTAWICVVCIGIGIGILVWSVVGADLAIEEECNVFASVTKQNPSTDERQVVDLVPHTRANVRKYTVVTTAAHVERGLQLPTSPSGDQSRLYMIVSSATTCGEPRFWYSRDELAKAHREGFVGDDMGDIGFTLTWYDGTAHVGYTVPCDPLEPITYDYVIYIVDAGGSLCGGAGGSVQVR